MLFSFQLSTAVAPSSAPLKTNSFSPLTTLLRHSSEAGRLTYSTADVSKNYDSCKFHRQERGLCFKQNYIHCTFNGKLIGYVLLTWANLTKLAVADSKTTAYNVGRQQE
jgi:hypothetical protein